MTLITLPGTNKTFDINGAHITLIEKENHRKLRTLGTPEFEATWYDKPHANVMRLVHELEEALKTLEEQENDNERHPCAAIGCTNSVPFADEPRCYTHSR